MTSRRAAAGLFSVLDPDGWLPHEAYVERAVVPSVSIRIFPEGVAHITVDGIEFLGVPRNHVPAFLRSVYGGPAWVEGRFLPPGHWPVVPLPGEETYREPAGVGLTPWLARLVHT